MGFRSNWLIIDFPKIPVDLNNEVIVPYGTDASVSAVNSNCSKLSTGGGLYCAAKIIRDGWQIKDDYPW